MISMVRLRHSRALQLAAVVCALFAAVGVTTGSRAADPAAGWLVPILAGIVVAVGFAAAWHVATGFAARTRKTGGIVALVIGGMVLTALALGASAQSIAVTLSGRAAVSAELGVGSTPTPMRWPSRMNALAGRRRWWTR